MQISIKESITSMNELKHQFTTSLRVIITYFKNLGFVKNKKNWKNDV